MKLLIAYQSWCSVESMTIKQPIHLKECNRHKRAVTYFLFSISGKLLLENLSTMTCKYKLTIQEVHVRQARDAKLSEIWGKRGTH